MKKDKSVIVGLVLSFVVIIAIAGIFSFRGNDKEEENQLAKVEENEEEIPEYEEEYVEEPSEVTQSNEVQAEISSPIEEEPPVFYFSEADLMQWPVDGNVLMSFSMDETTYFATLDQYKYNPAMIIEGKVGQNVQAAAAGKITKIETTVETGTTVTVDMGNGFEAIYGQLGNLNVSQGDTIEQGDVLGVIATPTKYYSLEGSNLYFQLLNKGIPVDPIDFFDV